MTSLACAAGIVLAYLNRRRATNVTRWIMVALAVILVSSVIEFVAEVFVKSALSVGLNGRGPALLAYVLLILRYFALLCRAVAIAGLSYVALLDRGFDPLEQLQSAAKPVKPTP